MKKNFYSLFEYDSSGSIPNALSRFSSSKHTPSNDLWEFGPGIYLFVKYKLDLNLVDSPIDISITSVEKMFDKKYKDLSKLKIQGHLSMLELVFPAISLDLKKFLDSMDPKVLKI